MQCSFDHAHLGDTITVDWLATMQTVGGRASGIRPTAMLPEAALVW